MKVKKKIILNYEAGTGINSAGLDLFYVISCFEKLF